MASPLRCAERASFLLLSAAACADQATVGTNSCAHDTRCLQYPISVPFPDGGISTRADDLTLVAPQLFAELPEFRGIDQKALADAKLTEGEDGAVWIAVALPTWLQITVVDSAGLVVRTTRIDAPSGTDQVTVQSATKMGDGLLVVANWLSSAQPQELLAISAQGDVRRMPFARHTYGDALGAIPSETDDEFLLLYIRSIARIRSSGEFVWEKGYGFSEAGTDGPGRYVGSGQFALQISIAPDRSGTLRSGIALASDQGELEVRYAAWPVLDGDVASDGATTLLLQTDGGDAVLGRWDSTGEVAPRLVMIERDDYRELDARFVGGDDHLFVAFRAGPREETEQYAGACKVDGYDTRCFLLDGAAYSLLARGPSTLLALSPEGVIRYQLPAL